MNLLERNLGFASKLHPSKAPFYVELCEYCAENNALFSVVSGRRTYEEQCKIYSKGRTKATIEADYKKGQISKLDYEAMIRLFDSGRTVFDTAIRTNTISGSEHLTGMAFDVQLININHAELELICMKWNISHPWSMKDPPHYSLAQARPMNPPMNIQPLERLKGLERRLERCKDEGTKELLTFTIKRLKSRLGV